MTTLPTPFEERLHRLQRQRDLALRGYERDRMSPELAEALRTEIRKTLDNDGKPFDVNVARRVYDLAIAARDMCVAATSGVKEAIDQIKDTNGPMESLDQPGTPESQMQASETFGARIIREILAGLPKLNQRSSGEDPKALVRAIAEAREAGLHDVAIELEVKLLGRPIRPEAIELAKLTVPRPIGVADGVEVAVGGYEHGFADGRAGRDRAHETPAYVEGYVDGVDAGSRAPNGLTGNRLVDDPPLCEACKKDPDPRGGSACFDCREIARTNRQAGTNGTRVHVDDGTVSRYDDTELRGRPSNHVPMDPIEREELEGK